MSSKAVIGCVLPRLGGAICWMLARWRQGLPDRIVSNLASLVLAAFSPVLMLLLSCVTV